MRRILSTGSLLLALTGAAWSMPGCDDDGPSPVDSGYVTVDTTPNVPPDVYFVDTTANVPDAGSGDGR
jgi:hypothetical protein